MIKRPLVWMLTVFIIGYIGTNFIRYLMDPVPFEDPLFQKKTNGTVEGTIYQIEKKNQTVVIYIKDVDIYLYSLQKKLHCNKILVYFSDHSNLKIGNLVAFSGQIVKFQKPSNFGQFNEAQFYREKDIDYKVYAHRVRMKDQSYSTYYLYLSKIRARIWNVYKKSLNEQEAGVIGAMILGEKSLLGTEIKDLYQQNGISHILSISGLHISLLGLSLYKLLRKIRLNNLSASFITIGFIFSYGCLTDFSISTNRSVVMMIIMLIAGVIGRTYDVKSAMALSALILLFQNPFQMYNSGFLLSFGAMIGLAYLDPIAQQIFETPKGGEEKNVWFQIRLFMKNNLITGLCVNLTTFPIILYFFYEFPIYSIFLNIIIIPFMSLLMLLALLGGGIGCFHLSFGRFLMGGVHYILKLYEVVCQLFLNLPFHLIVTGKPKLLQIILYYAVLFTAAFLVVKFKKKHFLLLLLLLSVIFWRKDDKRLEITFLDVGQGDGIYFESPSGTSYFVDGGSTDVKMVGQYRIAPFLKANGLSQIDYVIVTHGDEDHISGLKELIAKTKTGGIRIRRMILPKTTLRDEAYVELETLAGDNGVEIIYFERGNKIKDGEVSIECLHPSKSFEPSSRNSYSTVLSITYREFDLLLTGDVELDGEEIMLQAGSLKDYDVLKVAHHGSISSTSKEFLEVVKPEYAIISCGYENRYGHPHAEVLKRLNAVDSEVFLTWKCGAITIKTDGMQMEVERYLE